MREVRQVPEGPEPEQPERPQEPAVLQQLLRRGVYEPGLQSGQLRRYRDPGGYQEEGGGGEEETGEGGESEGRKEMSNLRDEGELGIF